MQILQLAEQGVWFDQSPAGDEQNWRGFPLVEPFFGGGNVLALTDLVFAGG
jgi:hypothetical protein